MRHASHSKSNPLYSPVVTTIITQELTSDLRLITPGESTAGKAIMRASVSTRNTVEVPCHAAAAIPTLSLMMKQMLHRVAALDTTAMQHAACFVFQQDELLCSAAAETFPRLDAQIRISSFVQSNTALLKTSMYFDSLPVVCYCKLSNAFQFSGKSNSFILNDPAPKKMSRAEGQFYNCQLASVLQGTGHRKRDMQSQRETPGGK